MDIQGTVKKLFKKATAPRIPKAKPVNTTPNSERAKRISTYEKRLR
jgi:hypothetical protein